MNKNNNVPPFAEEQIIEEQQNEVLNILNKYKQPIPKGFVKLKTEGINYLCSTPASWPKEVCERYNFVIGEEWITLDIPHSLLKNLELEKGQEITYPIYLSPEVLQRKEVCKGITLDNEEELFIDRPVSEKNTEKELEKRMKELDDLRKKAEKFEKQDKEKVGLEAKLTILKEKKATLQEQLTATQQELAKEKGWWDKWIEDNSNNLWSDKSDTTFLPGKIYHQESFVTIAIKIDKPTDAFGDRYGGPGVELSYNSNGDNLARGKRMIKIIAEYYKEKI